LLCVVGGGARSGSAHRSATISPRLPISKGIRGLGSLKPARAQEGIAPLTMCAPQGPADASAVEDVRVHEPRATLELAKTIATDTVATFGHLKRNIDFTLPQSKHPALPDKASRRNQTALAARTASLRVHERITRAM
jgi:hypothetical protein